MKKLNPSPHQKLDLPIPSSEAQSASQQLIQHIRSEISKHHGVISFARYMELALYTPHYGYYSGGSMKLGAHGDFTTAPEMSSLFGASIAQAAQGIFKQSARQIIEFGAGTGKLAFDILTECQYSNFPLERYFIVELSGELRARQEALLKDFPQVSWLPSMPEAFTGLVLGNEVLDAMPVELIMKTESGWQYLGVSENDDPHCAFKLIAMSEAGEVAADVLAQIPDADQLDIGYITEVHTVAIGFMCSVAQMVKTGQEKFHSGSAVMWIDYGFPAHEYYLPQREKGTLMCHYRHHVHADPFYLPGLQDITAHVDFTAIARAALGGALDVLLYTSQAGFLLGAGVTDIVARINVENSRQYLPAANALQKLISPAEMGELFKILVLGCDIDLPSNLLQHDRSHRL